MLLLIGVAIAVVWTYCTMILPSAFLHAGLSAGAAVSCSFMLTVFILAAAPALPIQSLFPTQPIAAAAAIGWPPLACAVMMALPVTESAEPTRTIALAIMSGCAYWFAVVMGAWLAARWRMAPTHADQYHPQPKKR